MQAQKVYSDFVGGAANSDGGAGGCGLIKKHEMGKGRHNDYIASRSVSMSEALV